MIVRFLKDLKQASKREKKRREVEERCKTVNLYDEYILSSDCYALQKTAKGWQDLFATIASFCNKYELVLDVGCGPYELMSIKSDVNTVGVDVSSVALRILLNHGFLGHVVQADCQYLPFKDGIFDCLISNQVIEHLPSLTALKATIKEMCRVSRNLMIVTPNSAFYRRVYDETHFFFLTVRDLKKMMPSFEIYASHLPPTQTLRYYLLYDSPKLRNCPLIGAVLYDVFSMLDSSSFMSWLNRKLWVGNHLMAVKTVKKF